MPVVGNKHDDVVIGRGSSFNENRRFATAIKEMAERISSLKIPLMQTNSQIILKDMLIIKK